MSNELATMQPQARGMTIQPVSTGNMALAAMQGNAEAMQVLASVQMAKMFPRSTAEAQNEVLSACESLDFAHAATYAYPRGGETVTGPSIRLAEAMLSAWGNAEAGWREVGRHYDNKAQCMVSECVAFCYDKEKNVRREIAFSVPHTRDKWEKSANGKKVKVKAVLTDDRDVYELCANMASRRIRACILQVLPSWLTEKALERVDRTLAEGDGKKSLTERIRDMEGEYLKLGVTRAQLEEHLGHALEGCNVQEVVKLGVTFKTIRSGELLISDFFKNEKEEEKKEPRKPSFLQTGVNMPIGLPQRREEGPCMPLRKDQIDVLRRAEMASNTVMPYPGGVGDKNLKGMRGVTIVEAEAELFPAEEVQGEKVELMERD